MIDQVHVKEDERGPERKMVGWIPVYVIIEVWRLRSSEEVLCRLFIVIIMCILKLAESTISPLDTGPWRSFYSERKESMDNNICNLNFIEGEWITTCKNNFCPTLEILVLEKEWIIT